MKKSLKTQMKKSISLFLAVLMILSCWVWIAPEKASADHTTGQYYIKYVGNITETGNLNSSTVEGNSLIVYWTKTDGTKGQTDITPSISKMTSTANNYVMYEGYIDGFPTSISWYLKLGYEAWSSRYFNWRDVSLYVGKDKNSCTTIVTNTDSHKWQNDAVGSGTKEATFTLSKIDGVDPVFQKPTYADQSVAIPNLKSTDVVKTGDINPVYYDQYGVKYIGASTSYMLTESDGGNTPVGGEDLGFYIVTDKSNKYHAEITQQMQIGMPSGSEYKDYYLRSEITYTNISDEQSTSVVYQKITVKYPTYSVTVDPNGGIMDLKEGTTISKSDQKWTNTGVYGQEKKPYPTGNAERTGYLFMGFWTVPQPKDKETVSEDKTFDATINAYESEIPVPVSTEDFNRYSADKDAKVYGNYVVVGKKTYYNAGKLWDEATSRKVSGGVAYYAWWVAKDIPVKFYDIDGKYLGEVVYKYGTDINSKTAPTPTKTYTTGAFTYSTFKEWRDITGVAITNNEKEKYKFGVDGLTSYILTPTYVSKEYNDSYDITFVKLNGETVKNSYSYRHILSGSQIVSPGEIPSDISDTREYSYKFKGWTTQVPANGKYSIVDNDDTFVVINEDWIVREDITYYPVIERTIKEYAVLFSYIDATGTRVTESTTIKYGTLFTIPDFINRTYAAAGKSHELLNLTYTDASGKSVTLEAGETDETVIFNDTNFKIEEKNLVGGTPIAIVAVYDKGTLKPYDVVFKYKDTNGNVCTIVEEVEDGKAISQDIVDRLKSAVPAEYQDEDYRYKFLNNWDVSEGIASANNYETDKLVEITPKSNLVFEAMYSEGDPFYTVTYIDGAAKYSERVLSGEKLPAWILDNGKEYIPSDYKTNTGEYKFVGWFDAKQTDEKYSVTNGNEYTSASIIEGNVTLYPQYIYKAYEFEIRFVGHNGEVLASGSFKVDDSFKAIHDAAKELAEKRSADDTYTYTFIGWDRNVGNYTCEGYDITFTARYRSNYIYYKAYWYSSKGAINGEAAVVTQHTYESKVYNPSVELEIPENQVFDGWYYMDGENEKAFERGMIITADMKFYAKYKDAPVTYTVTAIVNGTTTEYEVAQGGTAAAIVAPGYIYIDADNHKVFDKWYSDKNFETTFNPNAEVTGDITVYAGYTEHEHELITEKIIAEPTYYTAGKVSKYCVCDKEHTSITIDIDMLSDSVAPTGTIQLGSNKWSSTDETGAAATDGKEVSIYANANTGIIITINDTGDYSEYNPGKIGKGIKLIKAFVSANVYGQGTTGIVGIKDVYVDETTDLNNVANYVVRLGSFDGLKSGETYIVYYYAIDKAGNELNTKVRTAKFIYDDTAPEFEINGYSNIATLTAGTPTYCGKATVTGIEEGATVTVNGENVEVTYTEVDGVIVGSYEITEANNYIINVTDRAGNKTSKKIKVAKDHDEITTIINSTCTENGSKIVKCAVCGNISEGVTYIAPGHEWRFSFVPQTCEENGYNINTCEVCGITEKIYMVDNNLVAPALGHEYKMDGEEIVYDIVTPATCIDKGLKVAKCTRCGEGELSKEIPIDKEYGHNFGSIKTQKPTCVDDGLKYQRCKYCYITRDVETIEATGHVQTYTVVTVAPTCKESGKEATYCKVCDVKLGDETVIPATGNHIMYKTEQKAPTGTEDGYIKYACQTCDKTEVQTIDKLELYNVKFVTEDGDDEDEEDDLIIEISDKVVGESITADVLKDENGTSLVPEKKSDNEYDYEFAGWINADGEIVKLPFRVSGDITLKATFKAVRKIITHHFVVPTKWSTGLSVDENSYSQYGSDIIGYYGDLNKKPNTVPKFVEADEKTNEKLQAEYTFKFLGWTTAGANGEIVDFTKTPMTEDKTFIAVFETELKTYKVLFSKKNGEVLASKTVEAGSYVSYDGESPEYYDNYKHYTFKNWAIGTNTCSYDANIGPIYADTKIVAEYEAVDHNLAIVEDESWKPTCYKEGKTTEICECGYVKVTNYRMLEHDFEGVKPDANGKLVCKNEGCDHSIDAEARFVTLTFKFDDGSEFSVQVAEGEEYSYSAPVKESTASHDFPFSAWFKETVDEEGKVILTQYTIKQKIVVTAGTSDETFVAKYGETKRKYRVTYFDMDHNIFIDNNGKSCTGEYEYGSGIPSAPEKIPSRAYDTDKHYVFIGWVAKKGTTSNNIVEDTIEFYATYEEVPHNMKEEIEKATCYKVGGKTMRCEDCGYNYPTSSVIPMTPHTVGEVLEDSEASIYDDGVYRYRCAVCGEVQEKINPMLPKTNIKIQVYDASGKKASFVTVKISYAVVVNGKTEYIQYKDRNGYSHLTDANGFVSIDVPLDYTGWRASIYCNDGSSYGGELKTGGVENVFGIPGGQTTEKPDGEDEGCACTCHKKGLWGIFYRFLQKILRMFGAKPCCADQQL